MGRTYGQRRGKGGRGENGSICQTGTQTQGREEVKGKHVDQKSSHGGDTWLSLSYFPSPPPLTDEPKPWQPSHNAYGGRCSRLPRLPEAISRPHGRSSNVPASHENVGSHISGHYRSLLNR
ncbi:hypothetical protein E2C01_014239 [Portunus trituberculatus]|uniref:Uncharacterized protein n=1 Tax=Portunus trituberculatus TaxID=210409 RepID=A0A5B7DIN3_PORTR|nr:hypothetical protein [Portunus trituberculatus]